MRLDHLLSTENFFAARSGGLVWRRSDQAGMVGGLGFSSRHAGGFVLAVRSFLRVRALPGAAVA